ncbi:MAG: Smr/MutS family protein [Deltaproteobacteria bacterium]|nr:Smr/MutS family protein [Deltaproteobacteria bacterium]
MTTDGHEERPDARDDRDGATGPGDPVEVPIDGTLDLHAFAPRDVADVVATYLDECLAAGIPEVRVIHGKGVGVQRRTVEAVLRRHPAVVAFRTAAAWEGGWGATVVALRPGGTEEGRCPGGTDADGDR